MIPDNIKSEIRKLMSQRSPQFLAKLKARLKTIKIIRNDKTNIHS
jgi:DnaJ-domain-containing protein 1